MSATFDWARNVDIRPFAKVIEALHGRPLLVVGSGGSFGAAQLVANAHEARFGVLARPCTPLELSAALRNLSTAAVLILSAGGRNPDVLAALRGCIEEDVESVGIVCGSLDSPLVRLGRSKEFIVAAEFRNPSGKDGFLAVNSLLAFAVLLSRAYDVPDHLAQSLEELIGVADPNALVRERSEGNLAGLVERETLLVLYGHYTKPAAIDLESRFAEAALGRAQLADFRNFAHGRHHWLAKRGPESAVLALCTEKETSIAKRTLALLPRHIPAVTALFARDSPGGSLAAMVYSIALAAVVGRTRGIDPGRPSVPDFGRRIYHLRQPTTRRTTWRTAAVRRKAQALGFQPLTTVQEHSILEALGRQATRLGETTFAALVLDYDGTLCGSRDRSAGPSPQMSALLRDLLAGQVTIAIATGRGKSVRSELQRALERSTWEKVWIGYYNGAEVGSLNDEGGPDGRECLCEDLQPIGASIERDELLRSMVATTNRRFQITLELKTGHSPEAAWKLALMHSANANSRAAVVTSTHSIDIIAPGVSKRNLLKHLRELPEPIHEDHILCIGDRGAWPGNDFELLRHKYALSVDEVSPDLDSGWNLAPPGCRGIEATEYYLKCLTPTNHGLAFRIPES